jgi:hypothetical protein
MTKKDEVIGFVIAIVIVLSVITAGVAGYQYLQETVDRVSVGKLVSVDNSVEAASSWDGKECFIIETERGKFLIEGSFVLIPNETMEVAIDRIGDHHILYAGMESPQYKVRKTISLADKELLKKLDP